jgi:aldehyde dehydrogenase (NAD+)
MYARDRLYIGGQWLPSTGNRRIVVVNPATEEPIGHVPEGTPEDMAAAVAAARSAMDGGRWLCLNPADRAELLDALADGLMRRADEIAAAITAESGLPIRFVEMAHVAVPIGSLRYAASLARTVSFEQDRQGKRFRFRVRHLPVGVVGAIAPWNMPLISAAAKIGPALAVGCTVVLKPSSQTPLSTFYLADVAEEIGIPPGVLNIVPADRRATAALIAHPSVDKITFTGSTAAGKRVAVACAEQIKRCSLELGGNAAAVILDDAPPEETAAELINMSLTNNNGEACIMQGRVLVPERRASEYVEAICAAAKLIPTGDPTDPDTALGPMVTRGHRDRVLNYIRMGIDEGARVVLGGSRPTGLERGWYVEPTVLDNCDNAMRVVREEIFGPVLTVVPYRTDAEAVAIANDTEYGLSGSVWSADPGRAAAAGMRIRAGSMYINGAFMIEANAPFGGFKQSGLGREGGPEVLGDYLEPQAIYLPGALPPDL